jgi:hypothetical protein
MPSKRFVNIPPEDFELDQSVLRTNGYFYTEKTMERFCKKEYNGSGYSGVGGTEYQSKYLRVLFLYTNGTSFHSGSEVISGSTIDTSFNYYDHCESLERWNKYEKAHEVVQLKLDSDKWNYSSANKGTYKIVDDSLLTVQVYLTGLNYNQILSEFNGIIKNDSTIFISSYHEYHPEYSKELNEIYHFKKHDQKPDSTSYILQNRKKFGKK